MRSRTIREGSVGLLILLGLGMFGGLVLWIRGLSLGSRDYRVTVEFTNAVGMQTGSPVRYRGVVVGKVSKIRAGTAFAEVELRISPATLLIPRDSLFQTNQAGLIGETAIDITPPSAEPIVATTNPLAEDCQNSQIICDGDRLRGEVGVTFDALISSTIRLANQFSDPELFGNIKSLTSNSSRAAAGVATLTGEVTSLTRSVQQELKVLSGSANSTTTAVGIAANQFGLTAAQINSLLETNRYALVSTLNNVNLTSQELRQIVSGLAPLTSDDEFVRNLQALSVNAARASENFRNLSDGFGSTENMLMLQETLDSARATFQNAQKITADLDELTGDPEFRERVRDLIRGLSRLVSSTQQLQQQTQVAHTLRPAAIALKKQAATATPASPQPMLPPAIAVQPNGAVAPATVPNAPESDN